MTARIASIDGMFWPSDDTAARPVILRDCEPAIRELLTHFRGRDCLVQAGGNVGVYPVALADRFQRVITAEPDPVNFECLSLNLAARDPFGRVEAHAAAFGAAPGFCTPLVVEARNCGAHRVNFAKGPIPVITIDSLGLEKLDCIWLDVEGSELHALQGAAETVARLSPIIAIEDKGLHRAFEIPDGALQAWLAERGYEQIGTIGRDKVWRRP